MKAVKDPFDGWCLNSVFAGDIECLGCVSQDSQPSSA